MKKKVGLSWSLASRLCSLRNLIFTDLKLTPWRKLLGSTANNHRTGVVINRPKALKAKERGDETGKKSIFGQIYRQLNFIKPAYLRTNPDNRPWSVTYEGEGGTDAGGLFRDSLSAISNDLQSQHLRLFVQCPNSKTGVGDNQEKWLPNPACTSSLQLSMFEFIGKLMGVAIRGRHYLNLDLPSIVWKPLVGNDIDMSDLQAIDSFSHNILEKVSNIESHGVTKDTFEDIITETFTITSADGRQILLKPGGDKINVTWDNRYILHIFYFFIFFFFLCVCVF